MSHSDDVGLVLPPSIAPTQVVVVPILPKSRVAQSSDGTVMDPAASVMPAAQSVVDRLREAGLRVELCTDVHTPPGSRFYSWERLGVPLRLEIGSRELSNAEVKAVPRVSNVQRRGVALDGGLVTSMFCKRKISLSLS